MFVTVKGLKAHHSPGLDYVRGVTENVLSVCVKEVNQHVERENSIKIGLIKPIQFTAFQQTKRSRFLPMLLQHHNLKKKRKFKNAAVAR